MTKEFIRKISDWGDKVDVDVEKLAHRAIQRLGFEVVRDTPVDTGILRGGWQPSIGEPVLEPKVRNDQGGGMAASDIALKVADLKPGQTFYMVNNTRYARRLEYGFVGQDSLGRNYNQKGRFFVRDAVRRWKQIVEAEAAKLASGGGK